MFFSDLNFYSIVAGEPHSLRKEFEDFTASFVGTIELQSTQDHEPNTPETKGEKDEFVSEEKNKPETAFSSSSEFERVYCKGKTRGAKWFANDFGSSTND